MAGALGFLGTLALGLDSLSFSDVEDRADESNGAARFVEEGASRGTDPPLESVLCATGAVLDLEAPAGLRRQRELNGLVRPLSIVGVKPGQERPIIDLGVGGQSEQFLASVRPLHLLGQRIVVPGAEAGRLQCQTLDTLVLLEQLRFLETNHRLVDRDPEEQRLGLGGKALAPRANRDDAAVFVESEP